MAAIKQIYTPVGFYTINIIFTADISHTVHGLKAGIIMSLHKAIVL